MHIVVERTISKYTVRNTCVNQGRRKAMEFPQWVSRTIHSLRNAWSMVWWKSGFIATLMKHLFDPQQQFLLHQLIMVNPHVFSNSMFGMSNVKHTYMPSSDHPLIIVHNSELRSNALPLSRQIHIFEFANMWFFAEKVDELKYTVPTPLISVVYTLAVGSMHWSGPLPDEPS